MADEIPRSVMRRFAREQRAQRVQAETLIWRAVRNRRCNGAKFQRQVPLQTYIVDFICFERGLVVEIDGPSRENADQIAAD
jgi:very-short-patch-repair endonuclease